MTLALDAAVRTLLLPVKPGVGSEYTARAEEILGVLGVSEDYADWVALETAAWEANESPSRLFRSFVTDLLYSGGRVPNSYALDVGAITDPGRANEVLAAFAARYFEIHNRVMVEENCDNQRARRILSHTYTLVLLAVSAQMTASKIYQLLVSDGIDLGRSWSTTRFVLNSIGLAQSLDVNYISNLYEEDAVGEPALLGDLTLPESVLRVSAVCRDFGYQGDLEGQLTRLFIDNVHEPYLCMLHYQLTIQSRFDHRLANAYEFNPRGDGLLWLKDQYLVAGLPVGGSPFLNNAKAVDSLDEEWASSKRGREIHAARALVDILRELDRLSDPSRTVAGQYIRTLLHRLIRITDASTKALPREIPILSAATARLLLEGVSVQNTGTRGVIEQRLADCIALYEAGDASSWKLRGFGDSVFTTNTSQKKLGDVELKHSKDLQIIAVEAHGGRLTERYVQDHIYTMRQVLPSRLAELEDRAPITDWRLEVQFIAHELDQDMTSETEVLGLPTTITYRRYDELRNFQVDEVFLGILRDRFTSPLNEVHVHPTTRSAVLTLLGMP